MVFMRERVPGGLRDIGGVAAKLAGNGRPATTFGRDFQRTRQAAYSDFPGPPDLGCEFPPARFDGPLLEGNRRQWNPMDLPPRLHLRAPNRVWQRRQGDEHRINRHYDGPMMITGGAIVTAIDSIVAAIGSIVTAIGAIPLTFGSIPGAF